MAQSSKATLSVDAREFVADCSRWYKKPLSSYVASIAIGFINFLEVRLLLPREGLQRQLKSRGFGWLD